MRNIIPIKPTHEGRPISGRWVDPEIENQVLLNQAIFSNRTVLYLMIK